MRSSPLRHPARVAGASLLRLQSDERLAELAIAGHEAAFDAIVVRFRPAIQRYCAGIVGASRAEDATQQTLINAHDALKRTDEVRHLRSWLYRIAHNVSLNVLRAVRDDVPLEDVTARDAALARGDDGSPAAAFERSERFRATVAALQELPERQRAALVLRELEGRSHEEIADALGVTKGSARQHLMRARVAVRGAVTAITPYPLIVRLSEALSGSGVGGGSSWVDAAAGAGASATMAKLTAGVVATGALVGGAVGTQQVVHRDGKAATHAVEQQVRSAASAVGSAQGAGTAVARPLSATAVGLKAPAAGSAAPSRGGAGHGSRHGGGHGSLTTSGSSGNGSDDRSANRGSGHDRNGDNNLSGSRRGRDDRDGAGDGSTRGKTSGDRSSDSGDDSEGSSGSGETSSGSGRRTERRTRSRDEGGDASTPAATKLVTSSGSGRDGGSPGDSGSDGSTTTTMTPTTTSGTTTSGTTTSGTTTSGDSSESGSGSGTSGSGTSGSSDPTHTDGN